MFCSASRFAFAVFREAVASEAKEIPPLFFNLSPTTRETTALHAGLNLALSHCKF